MNKEELNLEFSLKEALERKRYVKQESQDPSNLYPSSSETDWDRASRS